MIHHPQIRFQLLNSRVRIIFEDPALSEPVCYMVVRADQAFSVKVTFTYHVTGHGPYLLREEGDAFGEANTAQDVVFLIYRRIYRRLLERFVLSGWVVFHAVLATVDGRRMLILGDKGSGKTTLAAALLYGGHLVEGDEMVMVRDGQIVAVPRRLHFKPGITDHIPQLDPLLDQLPAAWAGDIRISAADPSELGFDWKIKSGPVDRLISIQPNHGGETRVAETGSFQMLQHLLAAYLGWGESRKTVLDCASQMASSGGSQLYLGDPDSGLEALKRLL